MAFLSRKKEEDALKSEQVLLDATLMQNLQDRFCDANNLYLRCLDKNRTEVTKTYGSKEELEYLGSVIDMDRHIGLLERLLNSRIESVIEEDCGADGIRMCGVAVKVSGEVSAIWIVTGVMEDAGCDVPDYIMRTTPERYYKSIEFLETLSKQMFAVKLEELLAQEAFLNRLYIVRKKTPAYVTDTAIFYPGVLHLRENSLHLYGPSDDFGFRSRR